MMIFVFLIPAIADSWPLAGSAISCKHKTQIFSHQKASVVNLPHRCLITHSADNKQPYNLFAVMFVMFLYPSHNIICFGGYIKNLLKKLKQNNIKAEFL